MLATLSLVWIFSRVGLLVTELITANIYDISEARRRFRLGIGSSISRTHKQPNIIVIVYARNHEQTIEQCLTSIFENSYRKYRVCTVNDASSDATPELIAGFMKAHPRKRLQVLKRRKTTSVAQALQAAYKKHKAGKEIVLTISADMKLGCETLKKIALHFSDKETDTVLTNVRPAYYPSLVNVIQQIGSLFRHRSYKFRALIGLLDTNNEFGVASRGMAFTNDGKQAVRYAGDVLIERLTVGRITPALRQYYQSINETKNAVSSHYGKFIRGQNFKAALQGWIGIFGGVWWGLTLLLEPFMLSYFMYLAITAYVPTLLVTSLLVAAGALGLVILSDEHLSYKEKLRAGFFIPLFYLLHYPLSFLRAVLIVVNIVQNRFTYSLGGSKKLFLKLSSVGK